MSELGSQQDYWNSRAAPWDDYAPPLIPDEQDLGFVQRHLLPDTDTLVLGATPQLCSTALEVSSSVTAVDFAKDVIEKLRLERVRYECQDWFQFLARSTQPFGNIITDGGLVCLGFPDAWEEIAGLITKRLQPGGIFAARVYVSTDQPPKEHYDNPMLGRFVTSMGGVDGNWMVHPKHGDYAAYDMRYAFPPAPEVRRVFGGLALLDTLTPTYEEGARFLSFAWQRP